jgi:hypothetical protein
VAYAGVLSVPLLQIGAIGVARARATSAEISTIAEVNSAGTIGPIARTAAADGDDQHRQRVDP